jgi:hypothetical protein
MRHFGFILVNSFVGFLVLALIRFYFPSGPLLDQIFWLTPIVFFNTVFLSRKVNLSLSLVRFDRVILILTSGALAAILFFSAALLTLGNVDRSRSLYMFNWVGCAPSNLVMTDLSKIVKLEFGSAEESAFKMRIYEQRLRGLVSLDAEDHLRLTNSGEFVLATANVLNKIFNLQGWKKSLLWKEC